MTNALMFATFVLCDSSFFRHSCFVIRHWRLNRFTQKDLRTMVTGEIQIRVRYAETDRMGLLHHANYLVYFEQARTELLRSLGYTYKDLEDQGYLLVLT